MKKIIVEIDDREVGMELFAGDPGIEFDRKRLKVGDYVCGNVLVERKTIDDFCLSILDGRIEIQVEKMKESGKECFIIIVGHMCDRSIDIHENCILGKVTSLVIKHGMKVLFCEDEFQFMWLLKSIIEKCREKDEM